MISMQNKAKIATTHNDLMALLNCREGHFRFESGHHGDRWFDLDFLFLNPSRLEPYIERLADCIAKYNVDAICGPMLGGALLAQMLASKLGSEFYYSERLTESKTTDLYSVQYKIPSPLRQLLQGKKMVVIDDVISAGSAVRATIDDLQQCGANPVAIAALMVKGDAITAFASDNKLSTEHIISVSDNLWLPADCPLCCSGMPIENVAA